MATYIIESWEQLQAQIEPILEHLNENHNLALAAAANPLHALEELGYEIRPEAKAGITLRLRFPPRVVVTLRQLQAEVNEIANRPVDLDSPDDLSRLLFDELKLKVPKRKKEKKRKKKARYQTWVKEPARKIDTRRLKPRLSYIKAEPDPLEVLQQEHRIMEPLLEYRKLEASTPRLASRHIYDEVRSGKREVGITRIRGRLKGQPPPLENTPDGSDKASHVVNINSATAAELEQISGIGPKLAERIILYRTAFGPFSNVDSLADIKGIGPDLIDRLKSYLTV